MARGDRGVVGVSSTDQSDALAPSSNYGASVFLAAPGTGILTLVPGGGTSSFSGTSAAAASVAGAAGLLRAVDPSLSAGAVVGRLARSADAAGTVDQTGNGRLNLARALADTSTAEVQPAGAAPVGDGGPFVGPYVAAATRNLTLTFAGAGGGSVTITVPAGQTVNAPTTCGGSGTNATSQTVTSTCSPNITLTAPGGTSPTATFAATANAVSVFAGWSGQSSLSVSTCSGSTNPCTATLGSGPTLTVTFAGNAAPTATSPSFSPASPKTNDLLTASTTTADTDGNNVSVAWTWKVTRGANTCVIATASSPSAAAGLRSVSLDLSSSFSTSSCTGATPPATINPAKGDIVIVEATPNDGTVNGTLQSNSVTIANSAPVVTNVVIAPSGPTTMARTLCVPTSMATIRSVPLAASLIAARPPGARRGP